MNPQTFVSMYFNPRNRIIRGANKGLIEIPTVENNEEVQQIFLSNNFLQTLSGFAKFVNLRVLFLIDNKIQLISDIKYLSALPIETLNMKGNPITKLPYYQHHIVSAIKSLKFFDDHEVTDQLRATAIGTVEFDDSRLALLCINELRIIELEALGKDDMVKDSTWLLRVQKALSERTLESFGLDMNMKDQHFDKMREIASNLRMKNEANSRCKWGQIYDQIESIQAKVIDELSKSIHKMIQEIKTTTAFNKKVKSPNVNNQEIIKHSTKYKPVSGTKDTLQTRNNEIRNINNTSTRENDRISTSLQSSYRNDDQYINESYKTQSIETDNDSNSISYNIDETSSISSQNQDVTYPNSTNNCISFTDRGNNTNLLSKISDKSTGKPFSIPSDTIIFAYKLRTNDKLKRICFYKWYDRLGLIKKAQPILSISCQQSQHIPFMAFSNSTEKNYELLKQIKQMEEEIKNLKAKKAEKQQNTINFRKALEESVKTSDKMKAIAIKKKNEKKILEGKIVKSDDKYEENLIQFMLDIQVQNKGKEDRLKQLKRERDQKNQEIEALKQFISLSNIKYQNEIDALQKKLESAFNVTKGFRNEISRLKATPTAMKNSRIDLFASPTILNNATPF